ncbi:MAG: cupin domain-containing protein [Anaerolineae bacterium]
MADKVNVLEKFALFSEHWSPRIIGQVNDFHLKLAKIQGEFIWHHHDDTDELFYVVQGTLIMHFRDKTVTLQEGELIVVPQGVEHKPEATDECYIMMIERAGTLNTGNVSESERAKTELEWI